MEKLILQAKKRTIFGKKNKGLREKGFIPAVLYGKKIETLPLEVKAQDFNSIYKKSGDTNIIDLVFEDQGKEQVKNVLVQDISNHFLNGLPMHIDFYEVEMDKLIKAHIPIVFTGESPAVNKGGILIKSMNEVEVEALPKDLPHEIPVDISALTDFDQTIYIQDINFSDKIKVLVDQNTPIASISEPISEEELEKELGEAKSVEEVEVAGEDKESQDEESKEETKEQKEEKKEEESEEGSSK